MRPGKEDELPALYESSKWKYHVLFVPKRRRKAISEKPVGAGGDLPSLAGQKECQIIEGRLMPDHVHMCITILPKHPRSFADRLPQKERDCLGATGREGRETLPGNILGLALMPYARPVRRENRFPAHSTRARCSQNPPRNGVILGWPGAEDRPQATKCV
jgi:hypothetical protein